MDGIFFSSRSLSFSLSLSFYNERGTKNLDQQPYSEIERERKKRETETEREVEVERERGREVRE